MQINSPMYNYIENFKIKFPCLVNAFEKYSIRFPNANPLILIDLVKQNVTLEDMCNASFCVKCKREGNNFITTLVNGLPAKFCSIKCIEEMY